MHLLTTRSKLKALARACSAMVGDAAAAETAAAEAQARAEAAVEAQIAAERQLREAAEAQASEADAVRTLRQSEPRQEASLLHIFLLTR